MNGFQGAAVRAYKNRWVRGTFTVIAILLPLLSALFVAYVEKSPKEPKEPVPAGLKCLQENIWWLGVVLVNASLAIVWFGGKVKGWAGQLDAEAIRRSLLKSLAVDFLPAMLTPKELRSGDADHRITIFQRDGARLRISIRSSEMTENSQVSWCIDSRSEDGCDGVAGRGFFLKTPYTVPKNSQSQALPDVSCRDGVEPSIEKIKEYAKMTNTTTEKVKSKQWRARSYAVAPILTGKRRRTWGVIVLDSINTKPLSGLKLRILEQLGVAVASCIDVIEPTNGDDE